MNGLLPALLQDLRILNRLTLYLLRGELPKVSQTARLNYL